MKMIKYLKFPLFLLIYVLYCVVRVFVVLLAIILIQIIELCFFIYELFAYSEAIKEKKEIDFISRHRFSLKEKLEEFVDFFAIAGF